VLVRPLVPPALAGEALERGVHRAPVIARVLVLVALRVDVRPEVAGGRCGGLRRRRRRRGGPLQESVPHRLARWPLAAALAGGVEIGEEVVESVARVVGCGLGVALGVRVAP